MFVLGHLGIGLGLGWLLSWKSPTRIDYRFVLFGAILPAPFNVDRWFDTLLHDPYVQIGEIVGFVALIAFAWAHGIRSWKTLRDFIAHGTLPLFGLVQLQKD